MSPAQYTFGKYRLLSATKSGVPRHIRHVQKTTTAQNTPIIKKHVTGIQYWFLLQNIDTARTLSESI